MAIFVKINGCRFRKRPWRARRKRDGLTYSLGYWPTREEAEEVERTFDGEWPPGREPIHDG